MCTVSYVPEKKGYILTFNRDEDPSRKAELPKKLTLGNGTVITAPRDKQGGGTWIAQDENGRSACLLNGAFFKHIRQSPYRMSRGQLVIKAFEFSDFDDFLSDICLDAIEPFTLLLIAPEKIQKLVWDGVEKYIEKLSAKEVHLWSSATLYTSAQHAHKYSYFIEALKNKGSGSDQILRIHGKETDTSFIIDHPLVKTVSITQLVYDGGNSNQTYIIKEPSNEKKISVSGSFNQS